MNEIYVVGHRNPDTDSIVAAMSYAALRNALGDRDYVVRSGLRHTSLPERHRHHGPGLAHHAGAAHLRHPRGQ